MGVTARASECQMPYLLRLQGKYRLSIDSIET